MSLLIEIPDYIKVIYLFGLAGAGKNYVGDLLGKELGLAVYHADVDLTDEMRVAISEKRQFTDDMRNRYFEVVTDAIQSRLKLQSPLIVTQATYKARHRNFLEERLPGVFFIWIDAPEDVILKRLSARGDSVTPEYASKMRANFEAPDDSIPRLVNVGSEQEVLEQLSIIFEKFA